MKSGFFVIFLHFLVLEVLPPTCANIINSKIIFNCDNDCMTNIGDQLVQWQKTHKDKDDLLNTMAQTIKDLESRVSHAHEELTDVTDQLLTCNGSDRCPSSSPRGIYKIKLPGITYFEVPCDEDGWMTIQRRIDGSQDFNRTWEDYKNGFGDVKGEFFLGLEKLHRLTDAGQYELNIRIGDVFGNTTSAHYSNFKIGSEEESYPLTDMFGQYKESPAGHALIYNIGKQFSTFDRDNDKSDINCAQKYGGGWWYDKCGISSLNAFYFKVGEFKKEGYGIHWGTWTKNAHKESLTFVEMRIRLKINTPSA